MASKTKVAYKLAKEGLDMAQDALTKGPTKHTKNAIASEMLGLKKGAENAASVLGESKNAVKRSSDYASRAINGSGYRDIKRAMNSVGNAVDNTTAATASKVRPTYKPLNGQAYRESRRARNSSTILKSNEAINPKEKGGLFNADSVVNFFKEGYQGIKDTGSAYSRISKEMGDNAKLFDAGKQALKEVYKPNGQYDMKKIAGSYMVGAGAARVATGGGLYKDRNGNSDIVGVPLI